MWKMSIQYTVQGLEFTFFRTWVSSHNHSVYVVKTLKFSPVVNPINAYDVKS